MLHINSIIQFKLFTCPIISNRTKNETQAHMLNIPVANISIMYLYINIYQSLQFLQIPTSLPPAESCDLLEDVKGY